MKKAAMYIRVSTEEQTVEQQIPPLEAICKAKGLEYEIFKDVGVSGAKTSRPGLNRLLEGVRGGKYNAVIVWKLDRLGRSLKHLIQLVEEFNNRGVTFICASPDIDTTTSQGKFFLAIMGAAAELERDLIKDRIKLKMEDLKRQGVRLGRPSGARDKTPRRKSGYWLRYAGGK